MVFINTPILYVPDLLVVLSAAVDAVALDVAVCEEHAVTATQMESASNAAKIFLILFISITPFYLLQQMTAVSNEKPCGYFAAFFDFKSKKTAPRMIMPFTII
jgi:hypothetical protein